MLITNKPKDQLVAVLKGKPCFVHQSLGLHIGQWCQGRKAVDTLPGLAARKALAACKCGQKLLETVNEEMKNHLKSLFKEPVHFTGTGAQWV